MHLLNNNLRDMQFWRFLIASAVQKVNILLDLSLWDSLQALFLDGTHSVSELWPTSFLSTVAK